MRQRGFRRKTAQFEYLGFHGCDRSVAAAVISRKKALKPSRNSYDWLGEGIYFWENNPRRALEFAVQSQARLRRGQRAVKNPAVIGAVIDLGYCMNLLDAKFLNVLNSTSAISWRPFSRKPVEIRNSLNFWDTREWPARAKTIRHFTKTPGKPRVPRPGKWQKSSLDLDAIRTKREALGLTMEQAAAAAGFTKNQRQQ